MFNSCVIWESCDNLGFTPLFFLPSFDVGHVQSLYDFWMIPKIEWFARPWKKCKSPNSIDKFWALRSSGGKTSLQFSKERVVSVYFEWFWLLLVVSPCYFSKKCGLAGPNKHWKSNYLCFGGCRWGTLGGWRSLCCGQSQSRCQFFREWFGLVLVVSPCYFSKKCGLAGPNKHWKSNYLCFGGCPRGTLGGWRSLCCGQSQSRFQFFRDGWMVWIGISPKKAVSRAQTSTESQTIGVLGVVGGEPWGDGEAYAVARASRESNSLEKDDWIGLVLVVGLCYFSIKCGLWKVRIFVFFFGVVGGEPWGDGEAYAVARASRESNSLEKDDWIGLVLVVGPCYFSTKCGLWKVRIFVFFLGAVLGEPWGMEKPLLRSEPVEIPFLFAVDDLKIYMSLGSTGVILLLINKDAWCILLFFKNRVCVRAQLTPCFLFFRGVGCFDF